MDCCNYMQYRQQHSYYGGQYYEHPLSPYHTDFYGQTFYQEYYGPSPYYQQQWQCSPFTDYVYNPKEARIRKAMREANRDRSLGASPMLPRPSARRPPPWMAHHEDQLMLSPLANMRAAMEGGPVCGFPLGGPGGGGGGGGGGVGVTAGGGGGPYMAAPMAGYAKLEPQMPPGHPSVHSTYLQESPLAQLQQQTEMWHHPFPDPAAVRSGSTEHPFMVTPPSPYPPGMQGGLSPLDKQQPPPQAAPEETLLPPLEPQPCASVDTHQPRRSDADGAAFDVALTPMLAEAKAAAAATSASHPFVPPPPPAFTDTADMKNAFPKADRTTRKTADHEQRQRQRDRGDQYEYVQPAAVPVQQQEPGAGTEEIYLPLSCQTLLVPQELLDGNREYHQRYILTYFAQLERYEVFTVTGVDNQSFPYVAAVASTLPCVADGGLLMNPEASPRFIPTDVGFVPLAEHCNVATGVGAACCNCGCGPDLRLAPVTLLDLTPSARAAVACQTD